MRAVIVSLCIITLSTGCDAECDEPGRINGDYVVFANVSSEEWSITGFSDDQEDEQTALLDAIFTNGYSEWTLNYIPGKTNFQLEIDNQPYTASYEQDETSCNSFTLSFSGTYTTDLSKHYFSWEGEMSYFGSHLGGTFSYLDTWEHTVLEDTEGSLTIVDGEVNASIKDDTGS